MTTELGAEPAIRTYLAILRQQRWWVAGAAVAGLAMGVGLSVIQPEQYAATAQVLIQPASGSSVLGAAQQPVTTTDVQTELQLVTSAPVRQTVREQLGSEPDVSASEVAQTNVIAITAVSREPAMSARVANTYARAFVAYQQRMTISNVSAAEGQLRSQIAALARQVKALQGKPGNAALEAALLNQEAVLKGQMSQLQVNGAVMTGDVELVTPAQPPTSPSSPNPVQDALLGLAAGLMLGIGAAFLRNNLNDALASKEVVEHLGGAPVLALVPLVSSWRKRERPLVVSASKPMSPAAEAYRSLRTSLQFARHDRDLRAIVVTSPAASEGKTTTLANLGTVFAQTGQRVVLVSCDLRRPRLGDFFGLDEQPGLTTVLLGQRSLDQVLQPVRGHSNLWALPAGALPPNPAELLGGAGARDIFARLRDTFDLVLIDSPPVLPVTDAVLLSQVADGTLLVVATGQTKRNDLRRAAEKLAQVKAPVVGTVLNEVTKQASYGYGYGYRPYVSAVTGQNGTPHSNGKAVPADVSHQ